MFTAVAKYTLERAINRELARATTALDQTRQEHAHAEQLVARREQLTQRLDAIMSTTVQAKS